MKAERITEYEASIDSEPLSIIAVSDLHIGSKLFDKDGFLKNTKAIATARKNNIGVIIGDIMECIFPGDKRFTTSSVTDLDTEWLLDQVAATCEILRETGIRWVLVTPGNHEAVVQKRYGVSPTRLIAEGLQCSAGGYCGILDVYLKKNGATNRLRIAYNHGNWRGAVTLGLPGAKRFFATIEGWDVALFGDSHHPFCIPVSRLAIVKGKGHSFMVERKCYIVNCGSWAKMFSDDAREHTYAEISGAIPAPRVVPIIEVDVNRIFTKIDNEKVRISNLKVNVVI